MFLQGQALNDDTWECREDGHWIITKNLVLRPFTSDDVGALLAIMDDEVVYWQGYPTEPARLRRFVENWVEGAVRQRRKPNSHQFLITDRATGEVIGDRAIYNCRGMFKPKVCETGSSIKAGWRDRGLGSEELAAVLKFVGHHLGYPTVIAGTDPGNARALRQYEKAGFRLVGIDKNRRLPNGLYLDAVRLRRDSPAKRTCQRR